jgi:hypothetical protein
LHALPSAVEKLPMVLTMRSGFGRGGQVKRGEGQHKKKRGWCACRLWGEAHLAHRLLKGVKPHHPHKRRSKA